MHSRGKGRLTSVSLVALFLLGTLFAGSAQALPGIGSLSIEDATYNGTTLTLVFSRPVTGTPALTDFSFSDATDPAGAAVAAGVAATGYANVVTITGFTLAPVPGTSMVAIEDTLGQIAGTEWGTGTATSSVDYSFAEIHVGPVIVGAFPGGIGTAAGGHGDADAGNDTLCVQLSHPLAFAADSLFTMAELSDTGYTVIAPNPGGANPDTVYIAWKDTTVHKAIQAGMSKIALNLNTTPGTDTAATVAGVGGAQATSNNNVRIIDRAGVTGPKALFGLYNSNNAGPGVTDDEFFLVTNQDIGFPLGGSNSFATIVVPTGWSAGGGENFVIDLRDSLNAHQNRNYLRTTMNAGTAIPGAGDLIAFAAAGDVVSSIDSIGNVLTTSVPVGVGPGVVQAWGVNGSGLIADTIWVRLSEALAIAAVPADFNIDSLDAATAGWSIVAGTAGGPLVGLWAPDAGGVGFIHGCRIGVDSAATWTGAISTDATDDVIAVRDDGTGLVPIMDANDASAGLQETSISELNPGFSPTSSHAYIEFVETSDNADYYLLYTRVDGAITQTYCETRINVVGAIPIPNPNKGVLDTIRVIVDFTPGIFDVSGTEIEQGREVFFGVAPVNCDGNLGSCTGFPQALVAGPVACPRDVILPSDGLLTSLTATDTVVTDDNIWILGHKAPEPDTLVGDTLAVDPFDIVVVYQDAGLTDSVAAGPSNEFGMFTFALPSDAGDANGFLYLTSVDQWGNDCGGSTTILNDRTNPDFPIMVWDPANPERIYGPGDSVCVFMDVTDITTAVSVVSDVNSSIMSASITIVTLHQPADTIASAVFTSWGNDQTDNDADWIADSSFGGFGDIGAGALTNPPTDPYFTDCWPYHLPNDSCEVGQRDYAEAYVDEDGSGTYTKGEPFNDLNGNKVHDAGGDPALDYLDTSPVQTDEFPGTPGPFVRRENHIYKATIANLDAALANPEPVQWLKSIIMITDINDNMTVVEDSFMVVFDNLAPEQSQFTKMVRRNGLVDSTGSGNLLPEVASESECYVLSNYANFDVTAFSDSNDIDYLVLQINTGAGWSDLHLDPPGAIGADGLPGWGGIDDDWDGLADTLDIQVRTAMTKDAAADAADTSSFTGGDGIHCQNDGIDNNNDGIIDNPEDTLYAENNLWVDDDDEDGMWDGTTMATTAWTLADASVLANDHIDGTQGVGVNYWPYLLHVAGVDASDTTAGIAGDERDLLFPHLQEVIAPGPTGSPLVYTYCDLMGFNLNMRLVQNLYSISNNTEFLLRAVPYDMRGGFIGPKYSPPLTENEGNRTGNHNNAIANTICLTVDTTGVDCVIDLVKFGENTGADSAIAANTDYTVWDSDDSSFTSPAAPLSYTLEAIGTGAAIDSVVFYTQVWDDSLGTWLGTWTRVGADSDGLPYDVDWTAPIVENHPCDLTLRYYFYCQAFGATGVFEPALADTDTVFAELVVEVVDHVFPKTNLTSVGLDSNLVNGAIVPSDSSVHLTVGGTDLDDRDGNPLTNDIVSIEFQQRRTNSGDGTPGTWYTIGSTATPFDSMPPVDVKWRTDTLAAANYDIRAIGIDCEGNSNIKFTKIVSVTIDTLGLRAYIEPQVVLNDSTMQLHAQVFIHDVEVDHVEFQTWPDSNANCLADENATWLTIANDDNDDSSSTDPGGDVTLRVGDGTYHDVSLLTGGARHNTFPATIGFIDYDGDGYSPLDPVVADLDASGFYSTGAGDTVIVGSVVGAADSFAVTAFLATEFYTDGAADGFTGEDWIFGDNLGGSFGTTALETWSAMWDIADLSGSFLVRAVATDELGNSDIDSNTPIPFICCGIDNDFPEACVWKVALGDGGQVWMNADSSCMMPLDSSVCGNHGFVKVWASLNDAADYDDLDWIKFQWSTNNIDWNDLDVNDDDDMFADVDDTLGFSGGDPIVRDDYSVDQTFTVDAGDLLLRNGIAGELGDLTGRKLHPLVGEDMADGLDNDGDGNADEDTVEARDFRSPYCVFIDIDALTSDTLFRTSTLFFVRALAQDVNGNSDPSPTVTQFTIMENVAPETDVVWATTEDGDTVDVYPSTQDTDGGDQFGPTVDTLKLHVTVEDTSATQSVNIWYRNDPRAYAGLTNLNNPWQGPVATDFVYPYHLDWGIAGLIDGCYQFQVIAENDKCNTSVNRLNPYEFSKLTTTAEIEAAARPLNWTKAGNLDKHRSVVLDSVQKGAELWIRAELVDLGTPPDPAAAAVWFKYSDRVLGEKLTVQSFYPYLSDSVNVTLSGFTMFGGEANWACDVEVLVNDSLATFHTAAAFAALASPTKYDYKVMNAGRKIQFGAQLSATDGAWVSYNYGGWGTIQDSPDDDVDENGFFTSAWDPTVPVPDTKTDYTDAYDLIATVDYDFGGADDCLTEPDCSEGKVVIIESIAGPEVTLHGFFHDEAAPFTRYNDSGNPLRRTDGDHRKSKLCGVEYDAFVYVDSVVADSVKLSFDSGTPSDLTHYVEGDTLLLTVTMNESDYLQDSVAIFGDSIENVFLQWAGTPYQMYDDGTHNDGAADDGWWGAQVPIVVTGSTVPYTYFFDIDMSGDEFIVSDDRRNDTNGASSGGSKVTVRSDFWHRNYTDSELGEGVHNAVASAWGNFGRQGTNLTSAQGPVVFIIDCTGPAIEEIYIDPTIVSNSAPCDSFTIFVVLRDSGNEIQDILENSEVSFQFATDDHKTRWVELGSDNWFDWENGWALKTVWPTIYNPGTDNIDNDVDGETDEPDERDYTFSIRVVASDDAWNTTISTLDRAIRVDLDPPLVVMTSPLQGSVAVFGDSFEVCAKPATDEDAIGLDYYIFYFSDSVGQWRVIDPTPIDNSDNPWVPANGTNEVCVQFSTDWLTLEQDQYVQFLAVGVDSACNATDLDDVEPVIVAVNDTVGPAACILELTSEDCGSALSIASPNLAIQGDSVTVSGKILAGSASQVSLVELWVEEVGGAAATEPVAVTNEFTSGTSLTILWDANQFADPGEETSVDIWMLARDLDGNPDQTPLKVRVRIDRVAPSVDYTITQFIDDVEWYDDDGVENDSSRVVKPNIYTDDVAFRVYTADDDVASMTLQVRKDSTWWGVLGSWDDAGSLDFEPQFSGPNGENFWWLDVDSWTSFAAANITDGDGVYRWRVVATDWACNTNILDPTFELAGVDVTDPTCLFFDADNAEDGDIAQYAAGDDVTFTWFGQDNPNNNGFKTDIEHVTYWYVAPITGDTVLIGTDNNPVPDQLDTPGTKWTSTMTWTSPDWLVKDRDFTIIAKAWDTPWNYTYCETDVRIEDRHAPTGTRLVEATAGDCELYPADVDETVLNEQTIWWTSTVHLHAQTAIGDSGIAQVTFEAMHSTWSEWKTIDIDEVPSNETQGHHTVTIWDTDWDCNELDHITGDYKWPEGTYQVRAWAVDVEDNVEIPTMEYTFVLDKTAPLATATLDGVNATDITLERGSAVEVGATTNGDDTEDITVTWWMRHHYDDTPGEDAWWLMDASMGFELLNWTTNPDSSRPYSFDWSTGQQSPALEVGACYDIVAIASDLLCNSDNIETAWYDGRGLTFCVEDNSAPCATITHLIRHACGDGEIEQPENERVHGSIDLTATIKGGETDVQDVAFWYSTDNQNWLLADQDLVSSDGWFWYLNNWDSDMLPNGDLWFKAVAQDDAGNSDDAAACSAPIHLVIDQVAPTLATVAPGDGVCPFLFNEDGDPVVPLIFVQTDDPKDIWQDPAGVSFEWKKSVDVDDDDEWSSDGIQEWLYDAGTGYYTGTWLVDGRTSGKYDFRVTVLDSACNETVHVLATEVEIDVDAPEVAMTRLDVIRVVNGVETTVLFPVNNGVIIDIAAGEPVNLYATVTDDEQDLPESHETGITSVEFEVAVDTTETIYHIDLGYPDDDEGPNIYAAHWNTTALDPGTYWVRARAFDECGNEGLSVWVPVNVLDSAQPRAAIICWEPDILNDINGTTKVKVYATKWCQQRVDEVMFQYKRIDAGQGGDNGDDNAAGKVSDAWVTFGLQSQPIGNPDGDSPDSLWCSELEIGPGTIWSIGDQMELRAVAITLDNSGQSGDVLYYDTNPPYTVAEVVSDRFNRDLEPVHPDGTPWLAYDEVQLLPGGTGDLDSDFYIEVVIDSNIAADWSAIAKPWVLVTGDRTVTPGGDDEEPNFSEIVEMDPMNAGAGLDPYRWAGFTARSLLDSIGCGGFVYVNAAVVADSGDAGEFNDEPARIDIIRHVIAVHEVNAGTGSNGWVAIPGDDNLTVSVPRGSGTYGGLLMTGTRTPNYRNDQSQRFFVRPFGPAYDIRITDCFDGSGCSSFTDGYWATVTLKYNDEDLTVKNAYGEMVTINEADGIYPAWWEDDHWEAGFIGEVMVDTATNTVTFDVQNLCSYGVWSLVGVVNGADCIITPWCDGYTNQTPQIVFTLAPFLADGDGNDDIDEDDLKIWIDGILVAADDGVLGNGSLLFQTEDEDDYPHTFSYRHSTLTRDLLAGGPHTVRLEWRDGDEDFWYSLTKEIMVDVVAPRIEWDGGFINGPCVGTADCFVGEGSDGIRLKITDWESGVFTEATSISAILNIIFGGFNNGASNIDIEIVNEIETDQDNATNPDAFGDINVTVNVTTANTSFSIPIQDMGLKVDVWLIDDEDDQFDIDEYSERLLIQAATPAMLTFAPEICPHSDADACDDSVFYDPSDELWVTLPLTANMKQWDGREIEVVLYSSKVEHIGLDVDFGDDTNGEDDDEEFTKYIFGPFDCVGNVGSQYVARRFIVDTSAPDVAFTTPVENSVVAPGSEIPVWADLSDGSETISGAGIDANSLTATLVGPEGEVFSINPATYVPNDDDNIMEVGVDDDQFHLTLVGLDVIGNYALKLSGADHIGNEFSKTHNFTIGATVLQITNAHVWPNPFNPATDGAAKFDFNLGGSRPAMVEVSIFDFAGDLVWRQSYSDVSPGHVNGGSIEWRGTTSGGTPVASGGYIARIVANDGSGSQAATVKIAVRRFGDDN